MEYINEQHVRDVLAGSIFKYGPIKDVERTITNETLEGENFAQILSQMEQKTQGNGTYQGRQPGEFHRRG